MCTTFFELTKAAVKLKYLRTFDLVYVLMCHRDVEGLFFICYIGAFYALIICFKCMFGKLEWLDGELLGLQVYVLYCAASAGNTSMVNVSVTQGGRAKSAV